MLIVPSPKCSGGVLDGSHWTKDVWHFQWEKNGTRCRPTPMTERGTSLLKGGIARLACCSYHVRVRALWFAQTHTICHVRTQLMQLPSTCRPRGLHHRRDLPITAEILQCTASRVAELQAQPLPKCRFGGSETHHGFRTRRVVQICTSSTSSKATTPTRGKRGASWRLTLNRRPSTC